MSIDDPKTPEDDANREKLIEAAKAHQALQVKKHKQRNAENNTDEAISARTDTDPFTGE